MSLFKIIDWGVKREQGAVRGTVASGFYRYYDDATGWTWAVDVDIGGGKTLKAVPVALNNRDIIYAQQGFPVVLSKVGNNRHAVSGISKVVVGTTTYLYVNLKESLGQIVRRETRGSYVRPVTYGELAALGGYGNVPYGARGRFNAADDSLIEFVV